MLLRADDFKLSVRSANCLANDNIFYIGDLVQKTEIEMLRIPSFGRKCLSELKEILTSIGLTFEMEVPHWPGKNTPLGNLLLARYREEKASEGDDKSNLRLRRTLIEEDKARTQAGTVEAWNGLSDIERTQAGSLRAGFLTSVRKAGVELTRLPAPLERGLNELVAKIIEFKRNTP